MTLILYLIQVTICLAFFYGFYLFALQKETTFQTNRIYLVSFLLVSLILPLIKIYIESQPESSMVTAPYVFIGSFIDSFENAIVISPQERSISWGDVFFWIYLTGVFLMSIRFIREVIKIVDLNQTGNVVEIYGHRCILSEQVKSPFSFFHTIYLPSDHPFSEHELSEVIHHEHSHIAGRHSIDVVLLEILGIVLWVSPLIYLYKWKIKEVHEFLADAAVIKYAPWEEYAQFLIAQKYYGLQSRLSNQLIYSQLKNRLIMMTQKPSTVISRMKYVGVIPLLFLALIIFSFKEKPGSVHERSNQPVTDTLPTTYITALRLKSPSPGIDTQDVKYTIGLPIFPGCEDVLLREKGMCGMMKMTDFINGNMIYPESLKKAGVEGKVIVRFVVGTDGYIKDVAVQESLHPDADQEVLNMVNSMNLKAGKWMPAADAGKLMDAEMWLPIAFSLGNATISSDQIETEEPFTYVEQMPSFPGGMEAMYKYIYESIKYPKEDREKGNEGMVLTQFIVEADGNISNIKVVRGVSPGLNAEAIRITNGMNDLKEKWIPGRHEGKAVRVQFTLPFKFVLQADQENQKKKE